MKGYIKRIKQGVKKILIIITLAFTVLVVAVNIVGDKTEIKEEPIVFAKNEIESKEYIINREMVLGAINTDLQFVTYTQDFEDSDVHVDKTIFGERHTTLTYEGTYKIGMNEKEIDIRHIDEESGIVYIKLPKPKLISVEIPYNKVDFEKTQGWARLAMDEKEKNNFYKASVKQFKTRIMENKEIIKQVELLNRDAVAEFLGSIGVKEVIFE